MIGAQQEESVVPTFFIRRIRAPMSECRDGSIFESAYNVASLTQSRSVTTQMSRSVRPIGSAYQYRFSPNPENLVFRASSSEVMSVSSKSIRRSFESR